MPAPTQIVITNADNSTVTLTIPTASNYSDFVAAIVHGGGYWNGLTFIPVGQIKSIVAQ